MSNNVQQSDALQRRSVGRSSKVELFIRSRDPAWLGSLHHQKRDDVEKSNDRLQEKFESRPLLALIVLLEKRILRAHQTRSKFVKFVDDKRLTSQPRNGREPQKGDILHQQLGGRCRGGPEWWLAELVARHCLLPQDDEEKVRDEIARMWCAANGRSPDHEIWPEPFEAASEQEIAALIDPLAGEPPSPPAATGPGISLQRGAPVLAALLDGLPDAVLLVDANGTVVTANSTAREAFGPAGITGTTGAVGTTSTGDTAGVVGAGPVGQGLLELLPAFDINHLPRPTAGSREQPAPPPTVRMTARRTDGTQWWAEVHSMHLTDGRVFYEPSFGGDTDGASSYVGHELLMVVARDLGGTQALEAELVRQQRQTERILRTVSEGVIGVDTTGRIILVNPAAAATLGYPASELGGQILHPLVQHSHADGSPQPYEKTLPAQSLRSGKARRQRGQVLWAKDGRPVPVDLSSAPVHDGDQVVGAVLTFAVRQPLRMLEGLTSRHALVMALMNDALHDPLKRTRATLEELAAHSTGQSEPTNRALRALASEQARMTALVHDVLDYQRLDTGQEGLRRRTAALDDVVAAGVLEANSLAGQRGLRAEVSAPAVQVAVDPVRLARALTHVLLDMAVAAPGSDGAGHGMHTPTIKISAVREATHDPDGGAIVRIEVRGPVPVGSALHDSLARGLIRLHEGTLRRRNVPEGGSVCTLEVPVGPAAGEAPSRLPAATSLPKPLWQVTESAEARPAATAALSSGPTTARRPPAARADFVSPLTGPYTLASALPSREQASEQASQGQVFESPIGAPVRAVHAGTITRAAWSREGYRVLLRLDDGTDITHHHLSSVARTSGRVRAGDTIGRVGTADAVGHSLEHSPNGILRLQVRVGDGTSVSPIAWLDEHEVPLRGVRTGHGPTAAAPPPEAPNEVAAPAAGRAATAVPRPRTETVLTTRIRINVPGSRPIPPVVVRTPVPASADEAATRGDLPPQPAHSRALLVWPTPDAATHRALRDSGYLTTTVHTPDEIDAQPAMRPAAVFVDPMAAPITRRALQSLRCSAGAAGIPLLVAVGLGQAPREAAYGADPAVLLKALAPRDSEQDPPRVLLIEEREEVASALTSALERRGMQVARAPDGREAATLADHLRPNLVVMDLMREAGAERTGIVGRLRSSGLLGRTPLAAYTLADMRRADLDLLRSGRTVPYLAERSTDPAVQIRILAVLDQISRS